jgi:hypothetical protein
MFSGFARPSPKVSGRARGPEITEIPRFLSAGFPGSIPDPGFSVVKELQQDLIRPDLISY